MNGALSLVETLVGSGVDVCFTNPGTSEMHFVSALDKVEGMRAILALFEGVVTGAADGYWRMLERPASTLLHLGPGLGNGIANLHNAKKASAGIVNIVGEHASWHLKHDAPLTCDIEGLARPVSAWVRTSPSATRSRPRSFPAIPPGMPPRPPRRARPCPPAASPPRQRSTPPLAFWPSVSRHCSCSPAAPCMPMHWSSPGASRHVPAARWRHSSFPPASSAAPAG
jgi:acetolactate synthase I/II/III large subunit